MKPSIYNCNICMFIGQYYTCVFLHSQVKSSQEKCITYNKNSSIAFLIHSLCIYRCHRMSLLN